MTEEERRALYDQMQELMMLHGVDNILKTVGNVCRAVEKVHVDNKEHGVAGDYAHYAYQVEQLSEE